jgi:hypothetical protein
MEPHASERPVTITIDVDRDILMKLRPDAVLRDTPVTRLINDLLKTIAADRLVTAVLDDEKGGS